MFEWIKKIVGEAFTDDMMEKVKKEAPKHMALKTDFNARGDEITNLKKQLTETQAKIETLSKSATGNEELKAQLEKATLDLETFKNETDKREKNFIKSGKLKDALAKKITPDAVDLIIPSFNLDELNVNEAGEIVDIDSKIDKILESRPTLKLDSKINGTPPKDKNNVPPEDDFSKMSDVEYYTQLGKENKKE